MGKTRLVAEAVSDASAGGACTVCGRADPQGAPLATWARIIDGCLELIRGHTAEGAPLTWRGGWATNPPVLDPSRLESPESRFRLFDEVSRFLGQAAHGASLVLAVDDLHLESRDSLDLFRFLARGVRRMPILLLGTASRRTPASAAWTDALAELLREPTTERLALGDLDEPDVRSLSEAATGFPLSPEVVAALHARCEGNPLLLTALVLGLTEEGRLHPGSTGASVCTGSVPDRARLLVQRRLLALPDRCGTVLAAAAAIGREVSAGVVEAVLEGWALPATTEATGRFAVAAEGGGRVPSMTRENVRAALVAAAEIDVLRELDDAGERFRFAHELVRAALYDDLGSFMRSSLRRRVAEVLARAGDLDGNLPGPAHPCIGGFDAGTLEIPVDRITATAKANGNTISSVVPAGVAAPPALSAAVNTVRREGDYWCLVYGGPTLRLRHTRGLQYLSRLLLHPYEDVLALDLSAGEIIDPAGVPLALRCESALSSGWLDSRARASYRQRLESLRDELEEAERRNDLGRARRLRDEIDLLTEQLRAASGLGGRDRVASPALERSRSAVTKRIRAEVKRINAEHAALGRHLEATISTGYFCCYRPPHGTPPWESRSRTGFITLEM
jgi:hypothetical protein